MFDLVKREDILKAIQFFDENDKLKKDWTTYSLMHNKSFYSARDIATKALSFVYKDFEYLYDIRDAVKLFEKYNFRIERKNDIWKLGCNWGSGEPSFYELLKTEKVVIGFTDKGYYEENDLILITEGFTVRAIGQIKKGKPKPLNGSLLEKFKNYNVYGGQKVFYSKIEFYELSPSNIFYYELQQGIIKVRSFPILTKADNLWNNRKNSINDIYFKRLPVVNSNLDYSIKYPVIVFYKNTWDDYGYETIFNLSLFFSPNSKIELGDLKIGNNKDDNTKIPEQFKKLSANYFSLGITTNYYEKLVELFPNIFLNILNNLNDVAKDKNLLNKYLELDIFQKSFLRSSEADYILNNFEDIIKSQTKEWNYEFNFKCRIGNALKDHDVKFVFENFTSNYYRFYCIVGKNATGKTRYLSQFVNKLIDNSEVGIFEPKRPYFTKVIAASFSFFDKFKFPTKQDTNYEFIGIKDTKGSISEEINSSKIWKSYKRIANDHIKSELWFKCIESSLETEYLNFSLNELKNVSYRKKFIEQTENIFSSGQNIIFQFITRLIETIEENSIIIFDEPETHLHPNITGRLIRTIHVILNTYKSFCILATHSPIVVQEIPSKYIRIFDRQENIPLIYSPIIECFGENLSEISNTIFKVDEEKELYKTQLDELISQGKSFDEINNFFEHGLSLNARIYLLSKFNQNL
ncbi:AAA family ATPase [Confluentibacter sediminis]|uniref:AAA family ATPase n=1 Tax=Confluentibacter sediminis TaxID=2219045 RepID=UPI000DAF3CAA|nr:AAA family ATPase [Confluentibacter sediminis]